jgi:hypothetical protein
MHRRRRGPASRLAPFFFTYVDELAQVLGREVLLGDDDGRRVRREADGLEIRTESYLTLGVSTGAATCEPMLPASSV